MNTRPAQIRLQAHRLRDVLDAMELIVLLSAHGAPRAAKQAARVTGDTPVTPLFGEATFLVSAGATELAIDIKVSQ